MSRGNFPFQDFWKALGHFSLVRFICLILTFNSENFMLPLPNSFNGVVGGFFGWLVWDSTPPTPPPEFQGGKKVHARKWHEQQIIRRINISELSDEIWKWSLQCKAALNLVCTILDTSFAYVAPTCVYTNKTKKNHGANEFGFLYLLSPEYSCLSQAVVKNLSNYLTSFHFVTPEVSTLDVTWFTATFMLLVIP